ncbi:uncharacterized protein BP5553_09703 [Venustampulla echinocandica]|uniref:RING-type domain-containing protein n=1 Tax=Venustampulla echinocandica TaxID=2656787 RepID=A0A370TBR1_9HELO|nr:uncharacterized protein BP5553_09703 [Venustampulla echinocandica]RDL31494.1 hypothetical protein BP5553_09703 [Venustampulla echinocandica]
MVGPQDDDTRRARRRGSYSEWIEERPRKSRGNERVTLEPEDSGRRRIRVEKLERSTSTDRTAATPKMTSESHTTLPSQNCSSARKSKRENRRSPEHRVHRRRRRSSSRDRSPIRPSSKSQPIVDRTVDTAKLGSEDESSEEEEMERPTRIEHIEDRPRRRKVKVVYVTEGGYSSSRHKDRGVGGGKRSGHIPREDDPLRRLRTQPPRRNSIAEAPSPSLSRRAPSTREPASMSRSSLRRSHTISAHVPPVKEYIPSLTTASANTARRSNFLGSFFGRPPPQHHEPERLVECLTCLSDDIPRSKSAKLKCGHRMCHPCLRRIFKLSVTDPQHMPPKCCTSDHIPLKHVDRLFDINFKKTWNKKFQEYSTKNRIYCPARRCGEWIKPQNIHKEDGKKYGKCSRCKTKVCCLCNGKWHGSKDCPKDEETNKLLETAKQAGWQRCYSCRTMVELKEGCNHMTCHCTAEFCMICGVKWKSCNCPWFNYDAVEADHLQHMQIPQPVDNQYAPVQRPRERERLRRPRPNTYNEEITQRRRQERTDEQLARRLQTVSINDDDDYQGGIGDIHGVGNGADHFMNQDYIRAAQNILTGTFDQATAAANHVMGGGQARGGPPRPPQAARPMVERYPAPRPSMRTPSPPPILRRHTMAEHAYNTAPSTRRSERVVPRRTRTDYASEAAVHAPLTRTPERSSSSRSPRPSVLAGLGGARKGNNRVDAWRTYVEAGVTPEEGVVQNSSTIALRAAFVHGPYTLYTAAYPFTFNPNEKLENPRATGVPEFEPNLKAGGTFTTRLAVPEDVRQTAGSAGSHGRRFEGEGQIQDVKSMSWVIEVSSQIIFSASAAVHYEILLGRDAKSLTLGFANQLAGGTSPTQAPGQVSDHQQSQRAKDGHHNAQPKGVYSKAITLRVDDTASLWNTPKLIERSDEGKERVKEIHGPKSADISEEKSDKEGSRRKRQKKVHLVVLTHGLHGNLGSDMLYMKESIDATAKQAKKDARARRAKKRKDGQANAAKEGDGGENPSTVETRNYERGAKDPTDAQDDNASEDEDEDEEEVVVRGFFGNATRTERGIKYLGKRLARYVLAMTYPEQPYRPTTKKTAGEAISHALRPAGSAATEEGGVPTHGHSTVYKDRQPDQHLPYKITSISFIAHSLGGLVQTYAVGYIQKHSPQFFDIIKPINFIALATPFLGLSNENPLYVKFALDFGLVGRTGQDLGLTWRAPTIARSGWGAIVSGMGDTTNNSESHPESKPLLRILPSGPAHIALEKFRNRTVYSNVVNDGIVPLRTSCLLFLDWQGLGRVEKARREIGLVGTLADWGWAELTGQNTVSPRGRPFREDTGDFSDNEIQGENTPTREGHGEEVPQPAPTATEDDNRSLKSFTHARPTSAISSTGSDDGPSKPQASNNDSAFASIVKFFQPNPVPKQPTPKQPVPKQPVPKPPAPRSPPESPKRNNIFKRSQTLSVKSEDSIQPLSDQEPAVKKGNGKATNGDSDREDSERMSAPPKTTFFEAAGDLLKPPLPSVEFLINPESRPRTIFHDRIYHPADIPPPPLKKRATNSILTRRSTSSNFLSPGSSTPSITPAASDLSSRDYDDTRNTNPDKDPRDVIDGSAMKVEEKIARAYHRDLSWRKVLVRLEPDAHNNMIVRRMFANAYGWPVVKHLCDTHFSDSAAANTRDADESNEERAKAPNEAPDIHGNETTYNEVEIPRLESHNRTDSEALEATDDVPALNSAPKRAHLSRAIAKPTGHDRSGNESEGWSERDWVDSADDSDEFEAPSPQRHKKTTSVDGKKERGWNWTEAIAGRGAPSPKGTGKADIDSFLGKGKGKVKDNDSSSKDPRTDSRAAAESVSRPDQPSPDLDGAVESPIAPASGK